MKNEIGLMVSRLREMGVSPLILENLLNNVRETLAPKLGEDVIARLRAVTATHHRAMLVLGRNGYSVFTPEGHAKLQATARKHKPWAVRSKGLKTARA